MAFGRKLLNRFRNTLDGFITAAIFASAVIGGVAIVGAVAAIGAGMIISGGLIGGVVFAATLYTGVALTRGAIKNLSLRPENSGYAAQYRNPAPQTRPAGSGYRPYQETTASPRQVKSPKAAWQKSAQKSNSKGFDDPAIALQESQRRFAQWQRESAAAKQAGRPAPPMPH